MKITNQRTAISQSMDLFIIIAAVLGVGGVVTASIYNLVGSATSNSSVAVVGSSIVGAPNAQSPPSAISVTIKNNGGSTINCSPSTCVVTFAGTNEGSTPATVSCSGACMTSSPAGWSLTAAAAGAPLQFNFGTGTLSPGSETSFSVNGMTIGGTLTGVAMPTHGSSVTVNVVFGASSAQVTAIAQ
jgi:hypothetical protein